MNLFSLLLFTLGLLLETWILFRRAGSGPLPGGSRLRLGVGLATAVLIGLGILLTVPGGQDLLGFLEGGAEYTLEDGLAGAILILPATLLFVVGVFYARILPPLRRETLLSVLLLAWYVLPAGDRAAPDAIALVAVAVACLSLASLLLQRARLTAWLRFVLYLGNLGLLFFLAVAGFPFGLLEAPAIRPLEALIFAMAGTYLFTHCLFLLRLLLITLSLWLPRNRPPALALAEKKFPDGGRPGPRALALLGVQAAFLVVNLFLKDGMNGTILSFTLVVFPQLLATGKRA